MLWQELSVVNNSLYIGQVPQMRTSEHDDVVSPESWQLNRGEGPSAHACASEEGMTQQRRDLRTTKAVGVQKVLRGDMDVLCADDEVIEARKCVRHVRKKIFCRPDFILCLSPMLRTLSAK